MKKLLFLLFVGVSFGLMAQDKQIVITEGNYNYSVGMKNSILVTIPNSKKEVVEKVFAKEVKSWGGKMSDKGGEYTTVNSAIKKMFGGSSFNAYGKIYQDGVDTKVAVAVDLGGAFMTSQQHPSQYAEMKERLYKFAVEAGKAANEAALKDEEKVLSGMQKELGSFQKTEDGYKKDIEKYKQQISDTEKKIADNKTLMESKQADIQKQNEKIKSIKDATVK